MTKANFLFSAVYLSVFGGAIGLFAKISLEAFSPLAMIFVRLILALICFSAIFIFQKRFLSVFRLVFVNWRKFFILSLSGVGAAMVSGFIGLRYTTALNYGLIYNLSPIFMLVFAVIFLKERMSRLDAFFIFLAFAGAGIIIADGQLKAGTLGTHIFGDTLVLLSACGWALYSILGAKFSATHSAIDSLVINFGSFLIAAVFIVPFIFTAPGFGVNVTALNMRTLSSVAGLSILSTAMLFFLWFKFIKKRGGAWASLVNLSENFSGVVLPIIFLGEKMTLPIFIGGILMIIAIYGKQASGKHNKIALNNEAR